MSGAIHLLNLLQMVPFVIFERREKFGIHILDRYAFSIRILMMKCKLCLQDRKLVKSHIIPEFFYKPAYDERRISVLSTSTKEKNRYVQKGVWERLLCEVCEQFLNQWEKYICKVFYGGAGIETSYCKDKITLLNIDYVKFKLFQLSALWRSSVATHRFFSRVNLGPHEERIRRMILNEDPGEYYEYGCVMIMLIDESKPMDSLILQPDLVKYEGYRIYRFIFGSIIWLFFVSSHTQNFAHKELFLNKSGKIIIFKKEMGDLPFFQEIAKELLNAGKLQS